MVHGCGRTSRTSWIPWNVWQILSYVHFFSEKKIQSFDQILKAFSSVPSSVPHREEPFLWALGGIERFSEEWYDLICVLEWSLVKISRRAQSPFYIRRINLNTQSTQPISIKSVTEWHPPKDRISNFSLAFNCDWKPHFPNENEYLKLEAQRGHYPLELPLIM